MAETMKSPVSKEMLAAIRALTELDAAINNLRVAGIQMTVRQRERWPTPNACEHNGFEIGFTGKFAPVKVEVPSLKVAKG